MKPICRGAFALSSRPRRRTSIDLAAFARSSAKSANATCRLSAFPENARGFSVSLYSRDVSGVCVMPLSLLRQGNDDVGPVGAGLGADRTGESTVGHLKNLSNA